MPRPSPGSVNSVAISTIQYSITGGSEKFAAGVISFVDDIDVNSKHSAVTMKGAAVLFQLFVEFPALKKEPVKVYLLCVSGTLWILIKQRAEGLKSCLIVIVP